MLGYPSHPLHRRTMSSAKALELQPVLGSSGALLCSCHKCGTEFHYMHLPSERPAMQRAAPLQCAAAKQ